MKLIQLQLPLVEINKRQSLTKSIMTVGMNRHFEYGRVVEAG